MASHAHCWLHMHTVTLLSFSCSIHIIEGQTLASVLCAAYKFSTVGIDPCALNTSLPIGTSLAVTFTVFDNDASPLSDSVTRTVLIVAPCPSGQYYCSGVCQQITCAASAALSAAASTPGISLTSLAAAACGSNKGGRAMVPYGTVPTFSLKPCASYSKPYPRPALLALPCSHAGQVAVVATNIEVDESMQNTLQPTLPKKTKAKTRKRCDRVVACMQMTQAVAVLWAQTQTMAMCPH